MEVEVAVKELKRLIVELEEIAKREPWARIDFDVAWEYIIEKFGDIKRVNYSVKEPIDYKDIPHYYEIDCTSRP